MTATPAELIFDDAPITAQQLPTEQRAHFLALIAPAIEFYACEDVVRDLADALGVAAPRENMAVNCWHLAVLGKDLLTMAAIETWLAEDLGMAAETINAARAFIGRAQGYNPPRTKPRIAAKTILYRKGHSHGL